MKAIWFGLLLINAIDIKVIPSFNLDDTLKVAHSDKCHAIYQKFSKWDGFSDRTSFIWTDIFSIMMHSQTVAIMNCFPLTEKNDIP